MASKTTRRIGRWLAGAAAIGFACVSYVYLTLPDVRPLRTSNPTTTAFMELRDQEARARGKSPRRVQRWVTYNRMSRSLTRAVLVAEDDAFWQHEGLDVEQLQESLEADWASGSFTRGGSTITQQLAKNLYLSPSKNPLRKFKELIIARRLEAELTKSRILELYLNVIEWGDGIYGAEAAARTYFGGSAASLAPAESAILAGAIINPRVLNPARPQGVSCGGRTSSSGACRRSRPRRPIRRPWPRGGDAGFDRILRRGPGPRRIRPLCRTRRRRRESTRKIRLRCTDDTALRARKTDRKNREIISQNCTAQLDTPIDDSYTPIPAHSYN